MHVLCTHVTVFFSVHRRLLVLMLFASTALAFPLIIDHAMASVLELAGNRQVRKTSLLMKGTAVDRHEVGVHVGKSKSELLSIITLLILATSVCWIPPTHELSDTCENFTRCLRSIPLTCDRESHLRDSSSQPISHL